MLDYVSILFNILSVFVPTDFSALSCRVDELQIESLKSHHSHPAAVRKETYSIRASQSLRTNRRSRDAISSGKIFGRPLWWCWKCDVQAA